MYNLTCQKSQNKPSCWIRKYFFKITLGSMSHLFSKLGGRGNFLSVGGGVSSTISLIAEGLGPPTM